MKLTDLKDIDLENLDLNDYFDKRTIAPLKRDTLIKRLLTFEFKYCEICNKRLKFINSKGGTRRVCSHKCGATICISKTQATNLKKYGTKYVSQVSKFKEKAKKTNIKKYGTSYYFQSNKFKKKAKETNIKKYGVKYACQSDIIKEKIVETNLKKYGVPHFVSLPECYEKSINNLKNKTAKKYGVILTEDGYKHTCPICKQTKTYTRDSTDCYNLLQRIRLGHIPCDNCTKNQGINTRSSVEIILEQRLNELGIKTSHKQQLDIFLEDYNLAIEVNGVYWHSEKFKSMYYHKDKLEKFKKQGIQVLSFTDLNILNDTDKIVNYILGKIGKGFSVGASKCKIKEIDTKTARKFCEEVHIHGYAGGFKKYGLYYKDKLVSVCVVGKSRFDKGDKSLEIVRLANSGKIIGGFGRFLKRIQLDFPEYKTITTFIDAFLGLSDKNVFTRYGFTYEGHTKPNYKWVKTREILSRHSTQKHKLLAKGYKGDTEDSIMRGLGYYKIYDAGNYKYIFKAQD